MLRPFPSLGIGDLEIAGSSPAFTHVGALIVMSERSSEERLLTAEWPMGLRGHDFSSQSRAMALQSKLSGRRNPTISILAASTARDYGVLRSCVRIPEGGSNLARSIR